MKLVSTIVALAIMAIAGVAHAVPSTVAFSGRLSTDAGPVTGPVTIVFTLYGESVGGSAVWTEVRSSVTVSETGLVFVDLGTVTPFGPTAFDGGDRWLEVSVNGDTLRPRMSVGSVPYAQRAAFADETAAVPPGAVMMFDLDECPAGWSAIDAARGRAIVGVPAGGTRGGTVGTPLGDVENRTHSHSVDPAAVTSSAVADHTHDVDPALTVTSLTSIAHSHLVDLPAYTTTPLSHSHVWAHYNGTTRAWTSGDGTSIIDWTDGIHNDGDGEYPLTPAAETSSHTYTTSAHTHSHTIDFAPLGTGAATDTAHNHQVNIPSTVSTPAGGHSHTCDVGNTTSSAASTAQVMPYLQLLVCRKD